LLRRVLVVSRVGLLVGILGVAGRGFLLSTRCRVTLAARSGSVAFADDRDDLADLDGVVHAGLEFLHRAGNGGGDLRVDLVGGDLHDRLVHLDGVTHLDQPGGDDALGDRLPELRQFDVCHVDDPSQPCRRRRAT
jgi:hypothetical protein